MQSLYDLAEQAHIPVCAFPLPETKSMSLMCEDGSCAIAMDPSLDGTDARVHLSHELGHCLTGSFYNIHASQDNRRRHENRADKWSILELIPLDQLDDAIALGYTEVWDLADYFQVTEEFMKKAICYYVHGNLAAELYF